ncbi:hypothetical protein S245_036197 [Arachis hypogaea]
MTHHCTPITILTTPSSTTTTIAMSSSSPDHSPTATSMLCVKDVSETISDHSFPPSLTTFWKPYDDNSDINELIDAEPQHMASADYLRRCGDGSVDVSARLDDINWVLKVGHLDICKMQETT